ncbi:histidinol-phosphate transaminase [Sporobolomyces koalae]|uniref:histidinol-phosphate transaminase n=1 Tax=Sporobolomyces koalae TaxID=500713 RepID=UPI0031703862
MTAKPAHFKLERAIRSNILALSPYRCARDDYSEGILLDANENSLGHALPADQQTDTSFDNLNLNRYPSPTHYDVKQLLCNLRKVPSPENFFLGVGSDEAIDLLFRITCTPGKDRVLVCPPTYGMYGVCAQINDVEVVKVPLDVESGKFLPRVDEINRTLSEAAKSANPIKLTFLCSPGNPTGTLIPLSAVRQVLQNPDYEGLVVVDEAYIDFADEPDQDSAVKLLVEEGWDNLVVMQTLSKGFGLAAIRLGVAISSPPLVQILNNIKAPYNISTPTASLALRALSEQGLSQFYENIKTLKQNRDWLAQQFLTPEFKQLGLIGILGKPHANFLLVQIGNKGAIDTPDNVRSEKLYKHMAEQDKVVVRFRGKELGCEGCLRVTVGTRAECERLVERIRQGLERE